MIGSFSVGDWVESDEEYGLDCENYPVYRVESVNDDNTLTVRDEEGNIGRLNADYVSHADIDYIPGLDDGEGI
jgi:hypothetical protein